jgi:hypothetical protein
MKPRALAPEGWFSRSTERYKTASSPQRHYQEPKAKSQKPKAKSLKLKAAFLA